MGYINLKRLWRYDCKLIFDFLQVAHVKIPGGIAISMIDCENIESVNRTPRRRTSAVGSSSQRIGVRDKCHPTPRRIDCRSQLCRKIEARMAFIKKPGLTWNLFTILVIARTSARIVIVNRK